MPKKMRKRRKALWIQFDKKCYWCNCETVFPESGRNNSPYVPNLATVEHLVSKFFKEERNRPNVTNEQRLVLSCLYCNGLRARLEDKIMCQKIIVQKGK